MSSAEGRFVSSADTAAITLHTWAVVGVGMVAIVATLVATGRVGATSALLLSAALPAGMSLSGST